MDRKSYHNSVQLLVLAAFLALVVVRFSLFVSLFSKLWILFRPLLLGFVIAYLVDLPAKRMERKFRFRHARPLAVLLSLVFFLLIITLVLVLLIPQLGLALRQFSINLPVLYQQSVDAVEDFMQGREELSQGFLVVEQYFNQVVAQLKDSSPKIADYLLSLLGGAVSGIATALIAFIFSLYLLFGKKRLVGQVSYLFVRFLPTNRRLRIHTVLKVANTTFGKFFAGQFLEAIILGVLCTLGLMIFRFPYALTIGSVVGMTALIPLVGAYLGGAVGFVLLFSQGLRLALLFLLFLVILQQLEGNLIYPRVVGTSVGLPGVWVFASVMVGAGLFGIPGVLFGVPLAATVYHLLKEEREAQGS